MQVVAVGVSPGRFSTGPSLPFAAGDARRFVERRGPTAIARCDEEATREVVARLVDELASGPVDMPCLLVLIAPTTLVAGRLHLELADGLIDPAGLVRSLWQGGRDRVILALDLGRGPEPSEVDGRAGFNSFVKEFVIRPGRTLLVSDNGANASYVSGELQAGIWAYHLAEAFAGRDLRAREPDGRLTARSLREYLAEEIKASLARAFSDERFQSPVILASDDEETLADQRVEPTSAALPATTTGLELQGEETIPVKQLGGFQKSIHTAPGDTLNSSREWIVRLAEPDLRRELEQTVARLREQMGYTRRQLRASGPLHGGASILTPDFAVHFAIEQSAEKPQLATLKRTLGEIRQLESLQREELATAFPQGFTRLYQPFQSRADIETLIDMLEDARLPAITKLDYPTDLRHCDLTLAGFAGYVRVETAGLAIASDSPLSPADLVRGYAQVRELLGGNGT